MYHHIRYTYGSSTWDIMVPEHIESLDGIRKWITTHTKHRRSASIGKVTRMVEMTR